MLIQSYKPASYIELFKDHFDHFRLPNQILSQFEQRLNNATSRREANLILCAADLMANDRQGGLVKKTIDDYIINFPKSEKIPLFYTGEYDSQPEAALYFMREAEMTEREFSQATGIYMPAVRRLGSSERKRPGLRSDLIRKLLDTFDLYPADARVRFLDLGIPSRNGTLAWVSKAEYNPSVYTRMLSDDFENRLNDRTIAALDIRLNSARSKREAHRILCVAELIASDQARGRLLGSFERYSQQLEISNRILIYAPNDFADIVAAISYFRRESGLSRDNLAQKAGVSARSIRAIMARHSPSPDAIFAILDVFELYPLEKKAKIRTLVPRSLEKID